MSNKRGPGRPPKGEKTAILHAEIPAWLYQLVKDAAAREDRKLNAEVARRLKVAFGLEANATGPRDGDSS